MNISSFTIKFWLAFFVILSLFGCMKKSVIESSEFIKSNHLTKTTKPGAAVKLMSNSLISVTANERIHTEIALEIAEPSGELVIDFSPSQGLRLENTITPQTIQFDSSAPIKIPVTLIAATNGRYYLHMHISLKVADVISARNLALIVQVGPYVDKPIQLKKTAGENIITLPAQETIYGQ